VPGHARVSRLLVLPLRILREGSEDDFLAFSVPGAITSSLCGLESLTVRSSAAAARFANDPPDLEAIGTGANVDAVLHGTLLHGGDEVRISAQLLHVPDGTVLWSGFAQARRGDVFQLQDTLTRRIVDALAVQLTVRDRQLLRHDVPASGHAYELYLRANQLGYDARHLHAARDLYLQSVEEDPGYAPAWARLGRVYRVIGKYGGDDLAQSMVLAEGAFTRALELNPDLPEAHGLYAYLEADLGRASEAQSVTSADNCGAIACAIGLLRIASSAGSSRPDRNINVATIDGTKPTATAVTGCRHQSRPPAVIAVHQSTSNFAGWSW
jgi:adenylate cyclase